MVSCGGFSTCFVLGLLGLAYSAPVEVPYGGVPEIDIVRRNETISQEEAGPCRLSGTVVLSYADGPHDSSCFNEVCNPVKAPIAQQLPNGEEVEFSELHPWGEKQLWCSYVITFNSSTAMEASGVQDFLLSTNFSQHLSNLNFSTPHDWKCENLLPVEVSKLTEPVKSFVAGTKSVAHWQVGKKKMSFDFRFREFNARADLPDVWKVTYLNNMGDMNEDGYIALENDREFWQALQVSNFQEETQQLLVGDLEGCELENAGAKCHTSETGGTCSCYVPFQTGMDQCKSRNCTRNCSAYMGVFCDLSFPPHYNGRQAVNETLSSLAVNGTKATFDPNEMQVIEAGVDFECHQVVEVTIGVEYAFRMRCPLFEAIAAGLGSVMSTGLRSESPLFEKIVEKIQLGSHSWRTNFRSGSGLRWKQENFASWWMEHPQNPWLRLVALESSLGNKTDGWVNLTQNWSSTALFDNYYYYYGPSYYNHLFWNEGKKYIRHQVHLSVRVTREEAAAGMWSPEPIKVPCLVELEAFELMVKFQPAPGEALQKPGSYSSSGGRLAKLLMDPLSEDLWSRPGSQYCKMPWDDLKAWRLRTNQSGWPSRRRIIRSIRSVKASNSSGSLRLTLVPPAGGKNTTWKFCFFPADGSHYYPEVCSADFPVRVSQAECDSEFSEMSESSIGQRLNMIVWLQWLLFLACSMK